MLLCSTVTLLILSVSLWSWFVGFRSFLQGYRVPYTADWSRGYRNVERQSDAAYSPNSEFHTSIVVLMGNVDWRPQGLLDSGLDAGCQPHVYQEQLGGFLPSYLSSWKWTNFSLRFSDSTDFHNFMGGWVLLCCVSCVSRTPIGLLELFCRAVWILHQHHSTAKLSCNLGCLAWLFCHAFPNSLGQSDIQNIHKVMKANIWLALGLADVYEPEDWAYWDLLARVNVNQISQKFGIVLNHG